MTIHIVLPEDAAVTKSTQQSPARHCGDVISGHLEVITRGDFRFEVSLYFEG
jgi:hypothetical protein